jgi:death on curing protein
MKARIISFVSVTDVIYMHDMVIEELGGHSGIHDEGLLESAVNQPLMVFEYDSGEEQEITYLAAVYFFHIIKKHPFLDGNKRTGLLTALKFLAKNGYEFESSERLYDDPYQLAIETAASNKSKDEIAAFFKIYTVE